MLFIGKLVLSAGVMALVVYQLSADFDVWLAMSFVTQVKQLSLCIISGVASYLVMIVLLGVRLNDFTIDKGEK